MAVSRHIPMRTCIVTREKKPKTDLVRLVLDAEGRVVIDHTGKLPGKGVNISRSVEVLDKAIEKGYIDRAFKRKLDKESFVELKVKFDKYIKRLDLVGTKGNVSVRAQGAPIRIS